MCIQKNLAIWIPWYFKTITGFIFLFLNRVLRLVFICKKFYDITIWVQYLKLKSILHHIFIFNENLPINLFCLLRLLFFHYFFVMLLNLLLNNRLSFRNFIRTEKFQINLICDFLLSLDHYIVIIIFELLVLLNAFLWNIFIQFLLLNFFLLLKLLINWLLLQSFNWPNIFLYFFLLYMLDFVSLILLKLFQAFLDLHLFKCFNWI